LFRIGHLSDTHLCYQAYSALSSSGKNQRGTDIVAAFLNNVKDIVAQDPPLVIHSGDVADKSRVDTAYLLVLKQGLELLSGIRPNGTRRQVVVISGNHDQPRDYTEPCFLELFRSMPGVHIVTNEYKQIELGKYSKADPVLKDVIVHALPHNQLKIVDFEDVKPIRGKINILTTHGVAGGTDLYRRSIGREYAVPTSVLGLDWEYVAMGHWHKPGPIMLSEGARSSRVWYAGSTENMGFGDWASSQEGRGWLDVEIKPGEDPVVVRKIVKIREMLRLPVIEASSLTAEDIFEQAFARIKETPLSGVVASQIVQGVDRQKWGLVDIRGLRRAASSALYYEIVPKFLDSVVSKNKANATNMVSKEGFKLLLDDAANNLLEPEARVGAVEKAFSLWEGEQ
jgi:DNA repair exonuclease SbcCD nuclease subunit